MFKAMIFHYPSLRTTQPAIAVFKGILYTYVRVCCVRVIGCYDKLWYIVHAAI